MRVAIIGAGFTGLTAAYKLTKQGHSVTVFEKEPYAGGLASGIRHVVDNYPQNWGWDLERFYHHWFTNDKAVMGLIEELGVEDKLMIKRPVRQLGIKAGPISWTLLYPFYNFHLSHCFPYCAPAPRLLTLTT